MRNPQGVQLKKNAQNDQNAAKNPAGLGSKIPYTNQDQNHGPKTIQVAGDVNTHVVQQDQQANEGDNPAGDHAPLRCPLAGSAQPEADDNSAPARFVPAFITHQRSP